MTALRRIIGLSAMALLPALARAQTPITITGHVTTEHGAMLGNVTISLPELGLGAITRDDGSYSLRVPGARVTGQTATISARRVGYKPKTARVTLSGGDLVQDFDLDANPLQLGEVVITGAGTSTEVEKLGNVRNSVSPDLIVKSNEANVVQALAAKAPNVQVQQTSGDPGAGSAIQIRGLRTINGSSQPLFIVDGVPMNNTTFSTTNFNPIDVAGVNLPGQVNGGELEGTSAPNSLVSLNPDDIENIEILKGASAAAIYGSRAANGVILITTKRGHSGATKYTFRSSASGDQVTKKWPLQRQFGQGLFGTSQLVTRSWGAQLTGVPTYDHASEAFTTGHVMDEVFSVSGGTERTTFYLSGDYNRNEGVFVGPNNFFNRATFRLNATHRLTDGLTLGGNFSYADTRGDFTQRGNNTNGLLLGLFRTPPEFNNKPWLDPVTGLHRSYMVPDANLSTVGQDRIFANPFFTLYQTLNNEQANRSLGDVNASYVANSWLKFDYTLGADVTNDNRLEGCPIDCTGAALGGRITEGRVVDYQIDHNLTGTATWHLGTRLAGTFTAGQNLNSRNFSTFSDVGRGLIAPQPFSILNTLARDPTSDYQYEIHNESYFGQETFDIFDQLYLTAALRNDGSTTFGTGNRRSWFPKGSAAWTFTQLHNVPYLTFGKARISYGEAGQEPQPYLTSQTFSGTALTGTISQGTGLGPTQSSNGGLVPTVVKPATALNPERTKELEGGFDIGFLGDKADFSATWYRAQTSDVILITPTPPSTGYSSEAKNAGVFRNSGTELSLNLRPITTTTYGWDIGMGWARNHSLAVSIAGAQFLPIDNFSGHTENVAMVGQPLGVMRGLGWIRCGVTNYADYPALNLAQVCAGAPKGALYINNGQCLNTQPDMPCADATDRIIGDPNPRWTGNLHSTFRYKKLELSGLIDVKKGGDVIDGTRGALLSYGTDAETGNRATCTGPNNSNCAGNMHAFGDADFFPGAVVGPGAHTKIPIGENWYRTSGLAACPFTNMDEPCVEDGGYVKLRELSIAYTFDSPWVGRYLGLTSFNVRAAGRNLKTWTKYKGLDPETNLGGATARSFGGIDYFNLPLTRSFVFTVGLNR
ncbi:MAG TPA: SusC/RagA family TonB-linked outer membrane protein [Gemmatimonadaceae bacterium]